MLLYNFDLIKNGLTFILLEIFKPVTFLFLRSQSVTRLFLCIFIPGTNNFQIKSQLNLEMWSLWNNQQQINKFESGMNKMGSSMNKQVPVRTNPWGS